MFAKLKSFPDCYFDILKAGPAQASTTLWVGKGVLATLGGGLTVVRRILE